MPGHQLRVHCGHLSHSAHPRRRHPPPSWKREFNWVKISWKQGGGQREAWEGKGHTHINRGWRPTDKLTEGMKGRGEGEHRKKCRKEKGPRGEEEARSVTRVTFPAALWHIGLHTCWDSLVIPTHTQTPQLNSIALVIALNRLHDHLSVARGFKSVTF